MFKSPEMLLIDDDEDFCSAAKTFFKQQKLDMATISDATVLSAMNICNFKVILLDLDMPEVTGQDILGDLQSEDRPVIIIVSGHSDLETRMRLLEGGADFFMAKPVDLGELALIAKRALGRVPPAVQETSDWILRRQTMSISTPEGKSFGLSSTEFHVLEKLFMNAPNVTKKNDLITGIAGEVAVESVQQVRSLEVMISRMRRRFSSDERQFPIKSLRNVGYIFHGSSKITN